METSISQFNTCHGGNADKTAITQVKTIEKTILVSILMHITSLKLLDM